MKKQLTWILAVIVIVSAFVLSACVPAPEPQEVSPFVSENQLAVVINNGQYMVTYTVTLGQDGTNATTVEGVLDYLQQKGAFTVDWQDSGYGKFLNGISDLAPDSAKHEFVTVLTSISQYQSTEANAVTYEMGGIKIVTSNVGVTELAATGGSIVWLEIATW